MLSVRQTPGSDPMSLIERAQQFIVNGGDQYAILRDCIEDGGAAALAAAQLLAEDMYGGITYNFELKAPAAFALIAFAQPGLQAMVEIATRTPTSKNKSLCLTILSAIAANSLPPILASLTRDDQIRTRVAEVSSQRGLSDAARSALRDYVLGIEDEADAVSEVGTQLSRAGWFENDQAAIGELFAALAARRLAIGPRTIQAFGRLMHDTPDDEPAFHTFFERHPQLLDPAAAEVWSKPDLAGAREPDFVVRRTDDTYLVVEIETPGKLLMTEANQLSAVATQAVAQATGYRAFLLDRFPTSAAHFPRFAEPECLVVIGVEEQLSAPQRAALSRDNRSRAGLRVVGFDWIARRALAISRNVIEGRLTTQSIRVI
jgi:Shedu protein SduA, C-terminal